MTASRTRRPTRKRGAPDWRALYDLVERQAGHLSAEQALELGFTRPLISYHSRASTLRRVAHGIYRLVQFPPNESEELVVLWLWSRREGVFSHDTALGLHQLSDVFPAQVHMTLPLSAQGQRRSLPRVLRVHYADVPRKDRVQVGAVPVTTAYRTLQDCIAAAVSHELLEQAVAQATSRGLLLRSEVTKLRSMFGSSAAAPE